MHHGAYFIKSLFRQSLDQIENNLVIFCRDLTTDIMLCYQKYKTEVEALDKTLGILVSQWEDSTKIEVFNSEVGVYKQI